MTDRLGQMDGHLAGTAVLTAQGNDLAYRESGTLTLAQGGVMQATRDYHWAFGPDAVAVFFADGAPFHDFVPEGHSLGTPHLCGADLYTCVYDFRAWPLWTAEWTVKGPRKDYTSLSRYAPA